MLRILIVFGLVLSTADADNFSLLKGVTKYVIKTFSKPKKPINFKYRGKKNPKTGVRYNKKGYPVFPSVATCDMKLSYFEREFDKFKNSSTIRSKHFRICSKQLYKRLKNNPTLKSRFSNAQIRQLRNGKTPDGYTWHHEPKTNRLSLVDREQHAQTKHSGGFSLFH